MNTNSKQAVTLLSLAVVSFVGFYAYRTHQGRTEAPVGASVGAEAADPGARDGQPWQLLPDESAAPAGVVAAAAATAPAPSIASGFAAPSDELPPPVEGSNAVNIDYSVPQKAYLSMSQAAQNDDLPENRIAAVAQLRQLAYGAHPPPTLLDSIQTATVDADPRVAAAARAAYAEVSARLAQHRN